MLSVNGYFDGNVCIPLDFDKTDIPVNNKVIITFLEQDRAMPKKWGGSAALEDLFEYAASIPRTEQQVKWNREELYKRGL